MKKQISFYNATKYVLLAAGLLMVVPQVCGGGKPTKQAKTTPNKLKPDDAPKAPAPNPKSGWWTRLKNRFRSSSQPKSPSTPATPSTPEKPKSPPPSIYTINTMSEGQKKTIPPYIYVSAIAATTVAANVASAYCLKFNPLKLCLRAANYNMATRLTTGLVVAAAVGYGIMWYKGVTLKDAFNKACSALKAIREYGKKEDK